MEDQHYGPLSELSKIVKFIQDTTLQLLTDCKQNRKKRGRMEEKKKENAHNRGG